MDRWRIWLVVFVFLLPGGCQTASGPAASRLDEDCPSPSPCGDAEQDSWLRSAIPSRLQATGRLPAGPIPSGPIPSGYPVGFDVGLPAGPNAGPPLTLAVYRPLWPGCPSTLQVMAHAHRIAFQAARPGAARETAGDESEYVCDTGDAPLLRTEAPGSGPRVVAR